MRKSDSIDRPPPNSRHDQCVREATRRDVEESDRRRIRSLLRKPMHKRVNFLRVRTPGGSGL